MADGAANTALSDLTPKLGDAAAAAAKPAEVGVEGSRDPNADAAKAADAAKVADGKADDKAADAAALADAEKALTEAKTDAEKTAAQAKLDELKAKGGEKPKTGAPEKYEAFTLPEGMKLDEAALASFEPVARELNLTQEQAQKLVSLEAARAQARTDDSVRAYNDHLAGLLSAAQADKEIGGAKFEATVGDAKTFLKQFGTPELQKYLDTAEAGNHVEIIRAFAKAGRALADDTFVPGTRAAAAAPKDHASLIFPNHK